MWVAGAPTGCGVGVLQPPVSFPGSRSTPALLPRMPQVPAQGCGDPADWLQMHLGSHWLRPRPPPAPLKLPRHQSAPVPTAQCGPAFSPSSPFFLPPPISSGGAPGPPAPALGSGQCWASALLLPPNPSSSSSIWEGGGRPDSVPHPQPAGALSIAMRPTFPGSVEASPAGSTNTPTPHHHAAGSRFAPTHAPPGLGRRP